MGVKIRMAFESDGAGVSSNWNDNYKSGYTLLHFLLN